VPGNLKKNKKCVDPPCITAATVAHQQKQKYKEKSASGSNDDGILLLEEINT
jgi:hypothetical protein